jgi:hypothetical protein
MKLLVALTAVALPLLAADEPQPVRLLFAGSSSTYWNDMPREIAKLVSGKLTGRPGVTIAPELVGRSGSDIRVYSEPGFSSYEYGVKPGQSFLEKIRDEKPQMVVLQTVCSFITDETNGLAHAHAITRYCHAIRAAGGEPVFYEMGWGRGDREAEGRKRIRALAMKNRIRFYAPCSTAWARVYRERPDLALQHPKDSAHPGDTGHFLNLACFYAALTGESSIGKLPRTYHVWPHGKYEADTAGLAAFKPDAYQARLAKWMFKHMAMNQTATLDEPTARYLETIAWEETQAIEKHLNEKP